MGNGVRELLYSIRVRMNSNRLIHGPDVHGGGRSHAQIDNFLTKKTSFLSQLPSEQTSLIRIKTVVVWKKCLLHAALMAGGGITGGNHACLCYACGISLILCLDIPYFAHLNWYVISFRAYVYLEFMINTIRLTVVGLLVLLSRYLVRKMFSSTIQINIYYSR
jgi:hypothetical protein